MSDRTPLPLVSVLMTVYNSEKYLREAIDSLLVQSYSNLEIILINDGSTDETVQIINSYNDPRIKFHDNGQNLGIVKSRNKALTLANGKYLATLDSDDISLPDRIREQVDFMESNPEYGMCGTYYYTINKEGDIMREVRFPVNDGDSRTHFIAGNCFCHSSVMLRNGVIKDLYFSESYQLAEDFDLWYRIAAHSMIKNIPSFLTKYRLHDTNISAVKEAAMYDRIRMIMERMFKGLHLSFTSEDLELHTWLMAYNGAYFKDTAKIRALSNWIVRLLNQIREIPGYNIELLEKLIFEKWMVICVKSGHYNQLFLGELTRRFKGHYLKAVAQKLTNRNMQNIT